MSFQRKVLFVIVALLVPLVAACNVRISWNGEQSSPQPPPPAEGMPPEGAPPEGMPPGEMPPSGMPPEEMPTPMDAPPDESGGIAGRGTSDLQISAIKLEEAGNMALLSGHFQLTVTNNGPDALDNIPVDVWCGKTSVDRASGNPASDDNEQVTLNLTLNLAPGASQTVDTGMAYDTVNRRYSIECKIMEPSDYFEDPNSLNGHLIQDFP